MDAYLHTRKLTIKYNLLASLKHTVTVMRYRLYHCIYIAVIVARSLRFVNSRITLPVMVKMTLSPLTSENVRNRLHVSSVFVVLRGGGVEPFVSELTATDYEDGPGNVNSDGCEENSVGITCAEQKDNMPATLETTVIQHPEASEEECDKDNDDNNLVSKEHQVEECEGDLQEADELIDSTSISSNIEDVAPDNGESSKVDVEAIVKKAAKIREAGKKLHDKGNLIEAAAKFSTAADLLLPILSSATDEFESLEVVDDFATCRLHEALCLLKTENYDEAIRACSDILDDPFLSREVSSCVSPALRARAFHRRAKAHSELGNESAALEDARSAAFLGDGKAVKLYGKLMRQSSGFQLESAVSSDGPSNDISASGALLEALLSKSGESSSGNSNKNVLGDLGGLMNPFSLLSMLSSSETKEGSETNKQGIDNGFGSLAKSLVTSAVKRLEDESTQTDLCRFLQGTSGSHIQQMAGLAGLQVELEQANKLALFCHGVTPRLIRRTLRTSKVLFHTARVVQKLVQVVRKYRTVIIMLLLIGWTKSAILRPIPVSKRAMLLAKHAASA